MKHKCKFVEVEADNGSIYVECCYCYAIETAVGDVYLVKNEGVTEMAVDETHLDSILEWLPQAEFCDAIEMDFPNVGVTLYCEDWRAALN